jgi:sugar-specific transcriptional regulator TrmB
MTKSVYQKLLTNSGLDKNQAEVLEYLLMNGEAKASEIAKKTTLGRGLVYKALVELENLQLVIKKEKDGEVASFLAEHPINLKKILEEKQRVLEEKKKEIEKSRDLLNHSLPDLVSVYNLSHHKPGVRYYEGLEGFREVLFDSLNSKTEIYTFVDMNALVGQVADINTEYVKKREKLGIKKKVIVADTEENRKFIKELSLEILEVKFLKQKFYPFNCSMQIYDNKVSYMVLKENQMISILIEDPNIFLTQKLFFEFIWEMTAN